MGLHGDASQPGGASTVSDDGQVIPHYPGAYGTRKREEEAEPDATPYGLSYLRRGWPWDGSHSSGQQQGRATEEAVLPKGGARTGHPGIANFASAPVKGDLVGPAGIFPFRGGVRVNGDLRPGPQFRERN